MDQSFLKCLISRESLQPIYSMPLNIERLEFFPPPITRVHIVITTMNKTVFIPYFSSCIIKRKNSFKPSSIILLSIDGISLLKYQLNINTSSNKAVKFSSFCRLKIMLRITTFRLRSHIFPNKCLYPSSI